MHAFDDEFKWMMMEFCVEVLHLFIWPDAQLIPIDGFPIDGLRLKSFPQQSIGAQTKDAEDPRANTMEPQMGLLVIVKVRVDWMHRRAMPLPEMDLNGAGANLH